MDIQLSAQARCRYRTKTLADVGEVSSNSLWGLDINSVIGHMVNLETIYFHLMSEHERYFYIAICVSFNLVA